MKYKPKHMNIEPSNGQSQVTPVCVGRDVGLRRIRPVMRFDMPVYMWGASHFNIDAYACYYYEEDEKI